MAAKVNVEACVGCGSCAGVCPAQAIEIKDDKAVVKEDDCLSCGACEGECPVQAIKVE
ncbi:MAG: 4Fe-4S binding protein [Victivallales bacterium]|nr:4Fe-4S binding protein [Victivallales bacterium]MBQ9368519.1 4Fe-4S binding protein [Victivallales bacterium]